MDSNPHYSSLTDGFCIRHYHILRSIDYCDKSIVDPSCICCIILDLSNLISNPGLLLVGLVNRYIWNFFSSCSIYSEIYSFHNSLYLSVINSNLSYIFKIFFFLKLSIIFFEFLFSISPIFDQYTDSRILWLRDPNFSY